MTGKAALAFLVLAFAVLFIGVAGLTIAFDPPTDSILSFFLGIIIGVVYSYTVFIPWLDTKVRY